MPTKPAPVWPDPTEDARRAARAEYAARRIRKILATRPTLTDEQRQRLALIFWPGEGR